MPLQHPFRDLLGFPRARAATQQWRVVKAIHDAAPWWFGNDGAGRFDLHHDSDYGTCYLADDPYGALLETLLRDSEPTGAMDALPPLAPSEVAGHRAVQVTVPAVGDYADLTGTGDPPPDLHTAFGITDEIGMGASYERSQQWAQAWAANGFGAVRYRLRRGNGRLGTAVFGLHGIRDWPATSVQRIEPATAAQWRDGVALVVEPPHSDALTWEKYP